MQLKAIYRRSTRVRTSYNYTWNTAASHQAVGVCDGMWMGFALPEGCTGLNIHLWIDDKTLTHKSTQMSFPQTSVSQMKLYSQKHSVRARVLLICTHTVCPQRTDNTTSLKSQHTELWLLSFILP